MRNTILLLDTTKVESRNYVLIVLSFDHHLVLSEGQEHAIRKPQR